MNAFVAMAEACRLLGLEPNRVGRLRIDLRPGDHIVVLVDLIPSPEEFVELAELIKQVERSEIRTHEERVRVAEHIVLEALEQKAARR